MTIFDSLTAPTTDSSIRATVIGYAQAAKLRVTNFRVGSAAQQILETIVTSVYSFVQIVPVLVRGFGSLDTATDPGDVDVYDPNNVGLPPSSGYLSNYGQNHHGVARNPATFATGYVTLANTGAGALVRTFFPESLVFTWTGGAPPNPAPTYTNTADPSVYTNSDGSVTLAVGASLTLPVSCQTLGSVGSAPSGTLSLTTTLTGATATNALAISGNDREDAEVYRGRCRQAAARLSFAGPSDAFAYFAAKKQDGSSVINGAGNAVTINRVQVSQSSSTGNVAAYYASPSGPALAADVTAANLNIEQSAYVVPDAITFSGVAATATPVSVAGTVRLKARAGVTSGAVIAGILAALDSYFATLPIGGLDQDSGGNGSVFTSDIEGVARSGFPGIYDARVTTPSASTSALSVGHVATHVPAGWSVTFT